MLLKEALFRRHERLKGIPSIAKARKVIDVEYDLFNISHLRREVEQDEEWFALTADEVLPVPVWGGDKLVDGIAQLGKEAQYTTDYLVCVGNYFTPEVYVTIYVVKDLVSSMRSALDGEIEILGMRESAVLEWVIGRDEETSPEVCDE